MIPFNVPRGMHHSVKPKSCCVPHATKQTKTMERSPPAPPQNLFNMTVQLPFQSFKVRVENVFTIANLAEPSQSEKLLSRHVLYIERIVRVDCNLLIADFKISTLARFVADGCKCGNKTIHRIVWKHSSGPVCFWRMRIGPPFAVGSTSCPSYALVAIILRTSYEPFHICEIWKGLLQFGAYL
jgi:hypothetical protein